MTADQEAKGTWRFQYTDDGEPWYVQEPHGEFFDLDAKGFLEYITQHLNDYHNEVKALKERLADLLDFYEACEKDGPRDYCMTHHVKGCDGDAVYARAQAVFKLPALAPTTVTDQV